MVFTAVIRNVTAAVIRKIIAAAVRKVIKAFISVAAAIRMTGLKIIFVFVFHRGLLLYYILTLNKTDIDSVLKAV